MYPLYEKTEAGIQVICKEPEHVKPHLHRAIEFVYVIKGTLELGTGKELHHMTAGDLGIVFPDVIHHYQVLSKGENRACYILADPLVCGVYGEELFQYCPEIPVIARKDVPEDAVHALGQLMREEKEQAVGQAYVQILLGKSMPYLSMTEKERMGEGDLVYELVVYMAAHFREEMSLSKTAVDLGVSKYVLSRVFSGTFHSSFNRYLNDIRLSYVCELLEYTDRSVTDICMEAGFESQRTFHRVFRERYRQTPREYRKRRKEKALRSV